jgi:hypothetical protein
MGGLRTIALMLAMTATLSAQWLTLPTAGIPRTPDGKPNLNAPAPRTPDGKPQLAGLWRPSPGMVGDIARNLKPGEVPFQPWAEALYKQRRANNSKDDPTANCIVGGVPRSDLVGYPFKILQVPGMVVILYEAVHSYRQIFTDGRALPVDPNPTWFGYSVGRWEGDAFVVETTGFNDKGWQARDRQAARHRAVRPQGLRQHGHSDHGRRSEGVHEAVDGDAAARVPAGHGAPGIHLQREQQVLRSGA